MRDFLNQKWILSEGVIRMGRVGLHKELVGNETNKPKGGGWWHFDRDNNTMYLYSSSQDFGQVNVEDFEGAHAYGHLSRMRIMFSRSEKLDDALVDSVEIKLDEEN